jgi:hypothetical protein
MMTKIFSNACTELERRRPHPRHRRTHKAFKSDYLARVEERWRAIPSTERLRLGVTRTLDTLIIIDVRVGSLVITSSVW